MSRVAVFKTVPFKRDSENVVWFNSRESQQNYFASLGGKSSFSALFASFPETNFIPMTDTLARIVIDSNDIGGILLDSLNYQYIIVEWAYNGITKYLYYFITDIRSKNIRTYEYSLELDIFNTYLFGVDWDLDNGIFNVERAHIRRYLYIDNKLEYYTTNFNYLFVDDIEPDKISAKESITLDSENEGFYYAIIKGNISSGKTDWGCELYIGEGSVATTSTDMGLLLGRNVNNRNMTETAIPYIVLMFSSHNSSNSTKGSTDISASTIHRNIIAKFGENLITIIKSNINPSNFSSWSYSNKKWLFNDSITDMSGGTAWDGINFLGFFSREIGGKVESINTDIKIQLYSGNISKNSKISDDIKMNLYRDIYISTSSDIKAYNLLRTENFNGITFYYDHYISDNGIAIGIYIKDGVYANNYLAGDMAGKTSKLEVPTLTDSYRSWQQNNKNYMYTGYLIPAVSGFAGVAKNTAMGAAAGMMTGNPMFAAIGAASGMLSSFIDMGTNLANAYAHESDQFHKPDKALGSASDLVEQTVKFGTPSPIVTIFEPIEPVKNAINKMWYMYGYPIRNMLAYQRIFDRRTYFNYIKLNEDISTRIEATTPMSNSIINAISSRFNSGIRLWNGYTFDGSFKFRDLENWEYDIYQQL